MGTSRSVAEFAGKIKKVGPALEKERKRSLDDIGQALQGVFAKAVGSDLGGDNRFSGWPNASVVGKATVGSDSLAFGPERMSLGPTRVAEQGRNAGASGPVQGPALKGFTAKGRQRKVSRKRWTGSTKGKGTWTSFATEAESSVPKKLRAGFIKAVGKVF